MMLVAGAPGSAPSPQSEAVTSELQELSLQPAAKLLPLRERKNGESVILANLPPTPRRTSPQPPDNHCVKEPVLDVIRQESQFET